MVVVNDQGITLDLGKTVRQRRNLNRGGGVTVGVTIPAPLIQTVAESRGLSLDQFCQEWEVEFYFGGFEGAYLKFIPRRKDQEQEKTEA